jgi:sugar/nucleoside kinase (ribokinase family)
MPQIEAAARRLQQETGVGNVLIKLGSRGSMWVPVSNAAPTSSSSSSSSSPAFSIEALEGAQQVLRQCALKVDHVVDTTGAGDCFTGMPL